MKTLTVILFLLLAGKSQAQTDTSKAPFLQYPFIPPFTILKVPDSTVFTRDDLSKKKPVILMIFSPDCDHCKHQIEDMLKQSEKFKKYQIVMTSWLPYYVIWHFYDELKIGEYPNIVMGRDTKMFFPTHFGLKGLPGIYIYNKKHKLEKNFEKMVSVDKMLE